MGKKCLIISPKNKTIINFRKDLILDLKSKGYEIIVTGPDELFIEEMNKLNIKFIKVPLLKDSISIVEDLKYLYLLRKIIQKEKPNFVFSYTIKPIIYGGLACYFSRVTFFPLITGLGRMFSESANKYAQSVLIKLYKISLRRADKIIFQNPDDAQLFLDKKIMTKNNYKIILGSGVNMSRFKPISFPENIEFLMVSRIIYEKGVTYFLEAAEQLKSKYPNVKFKLIGGIDKSFTEYKTRYLKELESKKVIEYLGEVKDPYMFIGKTSVFVLPTFYREGLPRTILEAMSCGKPIITTDWIGSKETVNINENGLLVPIKSVDSLIKSMEYFILNPNVIETMGNKSLEKCKDEFEVSKINQEIISFWGV